MLEEFEDEISQSKGRDYLVRISGIVLIVIILMALLTVLLGVANTCHSGIG